MSSLREALRQGTKQATEQAYSSKDGDFASYLAPSPRKRFSKIPEGVFMFDIIPFIIRDDFNDAYRAGQVSYRIDFYLHKHIGPKDESIICPARTFNKPCPICEEAQQRRTAGEAYEEVKALYPQRRCLYNIWIRDVARSLEREGVMLFDMAHFSMEKNLLDLCTDPRTGELILFADPDHGRTIAFTKTGAKDKVRYGGFQMLPRTQPIPEAILSQAVSLEALIKDRSYEEIEKLFYSTYKVEQKTDENFGADPDWYNEQVQPASPSLYDIPAQQAPVQQAPVQQAPVQQQAPRKQVLAPAKHVCMNADMGGVFGKSMDTYKQCTSCTIWNECAAEHDRLLVADGSQKELATIFPSETGSMDDISF